MKAVPTTGAMAHNQKGQIAPVVLLGIAVLSVVMLVMYNSGQKIAEKSQLANAADAAAYSGAVWTARHLNFMAYTNRAMVANHVAVGHLVSYMSWFRYVQQAMDRISDYTGWVPVWGQAVTAIRKVVDQWSRVNTVAARVTVPVADSLNSVYRAAQMETKASLAVGGLNELMRETAKTYDAAIKVNDNGELDSLPIEILAPLLAKINLQLVQLPGFVKRYSTNKDDSGSAAQLITQSYTTESDMRNWIAGNRGWRFSFTPFFQLRKYGDTRMTQSDSAANWNASDELQFCTKRLTWTGWKTKCKRIAGGSASATEFYRKYSGVKNYYGLGGKPTDAHVLEIAVIASKEQSAVMTKDLMGLTKSSSPMLVAALAQVEFTRPTGFGFVSVGAGKEEYANLFNPFWGAHLAAFPIPGFG